MGKTPGHIHATPPPTHAWHGMRINTACMPINTPCMPASVANAHGDCDCDVSLITQAQHAHGIRQALITSLHTPAANARLSSLSQQDLGSFAKKAQKPSRLFFARPSASAPLPLSLYASLTICLSHYMPLSLCASLTTCLSHYVPVPPVPLSARQEGTEEERVQGGGRGREGARRALDSALRFLRIIWPAWTMASGLHGHALQHLSYTRYSIWFPCTIAP